MVTIRSLLEIVCTAASILHYGKVVAPDDVLVHMNVLVPEHLEDWRGADNALKRDFSGVRTRRDAEGVTRIKDGESSAFMAERTIEPGEPIPDPPSYGDKWRRRW